MCPGDAVVITRFDCLGRNFYETVTTIVDITECEINDPAMDVSRPADKVVANVMAYVAEWGREFKTGSLALSLYSRMSMPVGLYGLLTEARVPRLQLARSESPGGLFTVWWTDTSPQPERKALATFW